jgi:rod shape-determining protein MreD
MNLVKKQGGWVIFVTVLVAFFLQALPLPDMLAVARPEWVLLVMIYWTLALPHRPMLFSVWVVGLFQDVLQSSVLGLHALVFLIVIAVALRFYQRIRVASLLNQALMVFAALIFCQFLFLWAYSLNGYAVGSWLYWLPSVISALFWAPVCLFLRFLHKYFAVA